MLSGILDSLSQYNFDAIAIEQMPYLTQTNFPDRSDHSRYYLWEMRNLQIAANILRTIAKYPGKNLLVIIGGSHKHFLTKYLQQVPGVELMEF